MFEGYLKIIKEKIPSSVGILIMDSDGLTVEKINWDERIDIEPVAVEIASLANLLRINPEISKFGILNEMTFTHQDFIFLVKAIDQNYFIFYAMRRNGNLGRARFELEKIRYKVKGEL